VNLKDIHLKIYNFGFMLIWTFGWTALVGTFDCYIAYGVGMQLYATTYPTTDGVILESKAEDTSDDTTQLEVKYEYIVNGERLVGDVYRYDNMGSNDGYAEEMAEKLSVGTQVIVYYNPSSPSDAVLNSGIDGGTLFFAFFMTPFNVIAIGSIYILIGMLRRGGAPELIQVEHRSDSFGDTEHLRIIQTTPLAAFAVSMFVISIFVIGFGFGFHAPTMLMVCWWLGMLVISIYVYFNVKAKIARGHYNLIINEFEKTISIPPHKKRKQRVVFQLSEVVKVRMNSHRYKNTEPDQVEYRAVMTAKEGGLDESEYIINSYGDADTARAITEWLQERLNLNTQ